MQTSTMSVRPRELTGREMAASLAHRLARIAFSLTVVLIPFRYRNELLSRPIPPIYKDYTDFLFFASDASLLAVLVFWLVYLVLHPGKVDLGPRFLTIPLLGIVLFSALSTITSVDPALSIYHTLRLLLLFGFYLFTVQDTGLLHWIYPAVGIQLLIQSTVAIAQVIQQSSLGWNILQELALDPGWKGVSIVWAEGTRSLRGYGLTDHPNILGGCLAFAILVLMTWLLTVQSKEYPGWRVPLLAGLICLGSAGLLLTFSRSAWIGLCAGLLFMLTTLIKSRRSELAATLMGMCLGSIVILAPLLLANSAYLGSRLNVDSSFSQPGNEFRAISERKLLNSRANDIFSRHALLGVGAGAYPQALLMDYPDLPIDYQPAHYILLAAAADSGLFTGLSLLVALIAPWIMLAKFRLRGKNQVISIELIGLYALLLAISLVGLFDYYPWLLAPGRLWLWLSWGMWAAVYQSHRRGNTNA